MKKSKKTILIPEFKLKNYETLPISLKSTYLGPQNISSVLRDIPTYEEICPSCKEKTIWRTTGVIFEYIKCSHCKKEFRIKL